MRIGIYNNETAESQRVTKVLKTEMKRAGLTFCRKKSRSCNNNWW